MLVKTRNRNRENREGRVSVKAKVQNVRVGSWLCEVEELVWTAIGVALPISRT